MSIYEKYNIKEIREKRNDLKKSIDNLESKHKKINNLSEFFKTKKELMISMNIENDYQLKQRLETINNLLDINLKESYYSDENNKYNIPLCTFEIISILSSKEITEVTDGKTLNKHILNSLIFKLNHSNNLIQRIIYIFLLNQWNVIDNDRKKYNSWKNKVNSLYKQLDKECDSLIKRNKNEKTLKKYNKFWLSPVVKLSSDELILMNGEFEKEFLVDGIYQVDEIAKRNRNIGALERQESFSIFELFKRIGLMQIELDKKFITSNYDKDILNWLLFIVNMEKEIMSKIINDTESTNTIPSRYESNCNLYYYFGELGNMLIKEKLKIAKLEVEKEFNFKNTLTVDQFYDLCETNHIEEDSNLLSSKINKQVDVSMNVLCKNFISLSEFQEFLEMNNICYPPFTSCYKVTPLVNNDSRFYDITLDKQRSHYFKFENISEPTKKRITDKFDLNDDELELLMGEMLLEDNYYEKRFQKEKVIIEDKKMVSSEKIRENKKYLISSYLLGLAHMETEVRYYEKKTMNSLNDKYYIKKENEIQLFCGFMQEQIKMGNHILEPFLPRK